jgi:hypothetical protein
MTRGQLGALLEIKSIAGIQIKVLFPGMLLVIANGYAPRSDYFENVATN